MYGENSKRFERLVGKEHKFHGVDNNCFKLGNRVFEVIEDESDGYRSYLGSVEFIGDWKKAGLIFQRFSFANVILREYNDWNSDGYVLIDMEDNHQWLRFGTDNSDDYYPYFIFEYTAKPT